MMGSLPNGVLAFVTKALGTVGHKCLRDMGSMIHVNLWFVKALLLTAWTNHTWKKKRDRHNTSACVTFLFLVRVWFVRTVSNNADVPTHSASYWSTVNAWHSFNESVWASRTLIETLNLRLWAQATWEFSFFTNPVSHKHLWVLVRAGE